jgi:3-dehydroquinate dehydratase/shikimate dehydrogenase
MALICVPITVHDLAPALADAQAARDGGADLVEFRIDECFSGVDSPDEETLAHALTAQSPLPCIVTCRSAKEGGSYDGDEMHRVSLYERLVLGGDVVHPPRFLDLEHAAYAASANIRQKIELAVRHPNQRREVETSLILSIHDFQGRPADLSRRLLAASSEPAAAVVKVAYRARSLNDSLELLDLPRQLARPVIALGMGEFGVVTRLLAPKFGGFLTFAALRPSSATAPGQPTLSELVQTYRFRAIRPSTRVYGVVGWPVSHSASPAVHNAGFEAIEFDGVYVPLPIAASEDGEASYASFKGTMLELIHHEGLDLAGCSVTLPHKEHALRLAKACGWSVDDFAELSGAANTITIDRSNPGEPRVSVSNTDAPALAHCLSYAIGDLKGLRVAVVGAGGVARAAAAGLMLAGAGVRVHNRTIEKADLLANELRARIGALTTAATPSAARISAGSITAASLEALEDEPIDALVQCTSVGMRGGPAPDRSPASIETIAKRSPNVVVFDTVYAPVVTPLLAAARDCGLRTIDGVGMFVEQASRQFEGWTGAKAPMALFERIVRERADS